MTKEERREIAKQHTNEMRDLYDNEILNCVMRSDVYGLDDKKPQRKGVQAKPSFWFVNADAVTTAMVSRSKKKAILDFASYRNPGGNFLNGGQSQEASLCRESFLYNVLSSMDSYYVRNNMFLNGHLYTDRAMYIPDVRFSRGICDVIVCTAPNKTEALRNGESSDRNDNALLSRIKFIRDIAEEHEVETLILGAFGCEFGQNPSDVADAIHFAFHTTSVKNIVMAVPDENAQSFRSKFKEVRLKGDRSESR